MKPLISLVLLTLVLFSLAVPVTRADEIILAQTVQAGLTAQYQIEVHNETTTASTYRLALTGLPDLLKTTFTQGGPVVDQVAIPANSYGQITLRIEVPLNTPIGHYVGQFTATRDDGTAVTSPVTLKVENTYVVRITSQNVNLTTFNGQEFTFGVTATNSGAAAVTHLALSVGVPAKWVTQIDPSVVDKLEPGSNATYKVRVLVPASQVSIDQPVKLALTSDQVGSPESALTVRVQQSPSYLFAAGGVIALAVTGVFIYFRTKGRR